MPLFTITDNQIRGPGYDWGGTRTYCDGGVSALLVGVSDSLIRGNVVTNEGRPWNVLSRREGGDWWRAKGAAAYSDLPGSGKTAIAFLLARDGTSKPTVNNVIEKNQLRANCAAPGCVGLGSFTSRGTGFLPGGDWKPSFFTNNDPFGSNVGSKRCGGNWFAGNDTCADGALGAGCNLDDPQHPGMFHSDGCDQY